MNNLLIEAFLAIVQFRSLTKAAEYLNITQSTISYRLQLFEQELGFKLIERGKGIRVVNLTDMGKKFVPLAERWVLLSRDIEQFRQSETRQSLIVGAVTSVNTYVLSNFYRFLVEQIPFIDLKIRTQHSPELYDLIEQRVVDMGFTLLERHIPNIQVRPFFSEPMVVVRRGCSSTAETVHPADLIAENELFINWNPTYLDWHDKWWHLSSVHIHLDTAQLVPTLMVNSEQWTIVPLTIARSFQQILNFKIQYLSDSPPERYCFLITHKHSKPCVEECIQLVKQFAQKEVENFGIRFCL
jgi:DNA-binding transcriptional LysR family regulator